MRAHQIPLNVGRVRERRLVPGKHIKSKLRRKFTISTIFSAFLFTYIYVSIRISSKVCIARNIMFTYITFWGNIFRENMESPHRQSISIHCTVHSAYRDRRRQRRWKQRRVKNTDKSLVAQKRVLCEFVWIIKSNIRQPNGFAR